MKSQSRIGHLFRVFVCVTLLAVLSGSTPAQATDWPNYRGPDYDGISDEAEWQSTWQESPTIAWKASIFSSPGGDRIPIS